MSTLVERLPVSILVNHIIYIEQRDPITLDNDPQILEKVGRRAVPSYEQSHYKT